MVGCEQRDRRSERRLAACGRQVRLESLARGNYLEERRADRQVDECERRERAEVGEQFDPARVTAGREEGIAAGERRERDRGGLEGDGAERPVAEPPHAECRAPGKESRGPWPEHDRSRDVQGRGDAEDLEVRRFAAADPVGVLDELGHDQRRGEEGEWSPVRAAQELERRDAERGQAERDHSGVRGQRAHVFRYRYGGRFSFKPAGR